MSNVWYDHVKCVVSNVSSLMLLKVERVEHARAQSCVRTSDKTIFVVLGSCGFEFRTMMLANDRRVYDERPSTTGSSPRIDDTSDHVDESVIHAVILPHAKDRAKC